MAILNISKVFIHQISGINYGQALGGGSDLQHLIDIAWAEILICLYIRNVVAATERVIDGGVQICREVWEVIEAFC